LVRRHAPRRIPVHDDLTVLRIVERPTDERLAVMTITFEAVVTLAGGRARIVDAGGVLVAVALPRVDVTERPAPPHVALAGEARRSVRARAMHAGLTRPVAAAHAVAGVASGARGTVHGPPGASRGAALATSAASLATSAPARPSRAIVFVRDRAPLARPPLVTFARERIGSRRRLRHAAAVDAGVLRAGAQRKQVRTPPTTVREDGQQQGCTRPRQQALWHNSTTHHTPPGSDCHARTR